MISNISLLFNGSYARFRNWQQSLADSVFFRNKSYRLLCMAQYISSFGTRAAIYATQAQIRHSEIDTSKALSLFAFSQFAPLLFVALFGGMFADRYNRKKIWLTGQFMLVILSVVLLLNQSIVGVSNLTVLCLVTGVNAAIDGFCLPAVASMTQQIVAKDDFPSVSILKNFLHSASKIASPILVGNLIGTRYGFKPAFGLVGSLFSLSLAIMIFLPNVQKINPINNNNNNNNMVSVVKSAVSDLKQGFSYVFSKQELVASYAIDFIAMALGGCSIIVSAMGKKYGISDQAIGFFQAGPAIGGCIVALFFSEWVKSIKKHGFAVIAAASCWGLAITMFGVSSKIFWLAFLFLTLSGACNAISSNCRNIIWNEMVSNDFRGRLAGVEVLSAWSGPKIGDTRVSGMASALGNIQASIISGGIMATICVIASGYLLFPKFVAYKVRKLQ